MTQPFYVAPEQVMKDRADYARKGIARGRSLIGMSCDEAILICAENPSRLLRKIYEIYDRIAFAGVGKYNEFDQLRIAGVRSADLKGYAYSREDVDGRSLANGYAQSLGNVFTHEMKPMEVEILIAEVSNGPDDDRLFHILYDGTLIDEASFTVLGGDAEAVRNRVASEFEATPSLADGAERRIYGIENEYGVTCTLARCASTQPRRGRRYLFRRVVSWGRSVQRVPGQRRAAVPRRRLAPRVRHARVRLVVRPGRSRQGGGADPRAAPRRRPSSASARRASAARLPVQATTPTRPATPTAATRTTSPAVRRTWLDYTEVLIPFLVSRQIYAGAGKVLQTARGTTFCRSSQRAEHIWEGVSSPPPAAVRSSTPATSPTPTPSATDGSTSSSATRT
jgi:proteasome alpha subunit